MIDATSKYAAVYSAQPHLSRAGYTPLHLAVRKYVLVVSWYDWNRGDVGITKLLLDSGADKKARDRRGRLPLHIAVTKVLFGNAISHIARAKTPLFRYC